MKRILYKCNGKKCKDVVCAGKGELHSCADDRILGSECRHTTETQYAANGRIKGLFDLIKRFEIHFRPWLYMVER